MKTLTTFNQFILSLISFKAHSITIIFFLFFITSKVHSQIPDSILSLTDTNFFQITSKVDAYLNSISISGSGLLSSDEEDDGWKMHYGRWKSFWETRIDENGNFNKFFTELRYAKSSNGCNLENQYTWKSIGPDRDFYAQNIGRITAISVNPLDFNDIVVAGNNSCFWRTTNGGISWVNTADDEHLSYLGVNDNDIIRYSKNSTWIFAGTSKLNAGPIVNIDNNFSMIESNKGSGIVKSLDGGNTWGILPGFLELGVENINDIKEIQNYSAQDASSVYTESTPSIGNICPKFIYGDSKFLFSYIFNSTTNLYRKKTLIDAWSIPFRDIGTHHIAYLVNNGFERIYISPVISQQNKVFLVVDAGNWETSGALFRAKKLISFDYNGEDATNLTDIDLNVDAITGYSYTDNDIMDISLDFNYKGDITLIVSFIDCTYAIYKKLTTDVGFNLINHVTNPSYTIGNMKTFRVSPYNDNVMYIECQASLIGGCNPNALSTHQLRNIMKSTDNGITFTPYNTLYISSNSSSTTNTSLLMHVDLHAINIYDNNKSEGADPLGNNDKIYLGTDGGICKTINGGNFYSNINGKGIDIGMYYGVGVTEQDTKYVLAGAQDGSHDIYKNETWTTEITGDKGKFIINPLDKSKYIYIVNNSFEKHLWPFNELSSDITTLGPYIELPLTLDTKFTDRVYLGAKTVKTNKESHGTILPEVIINTNAEDDRTSSIFSITKSTDVRPSILFSQNKFDGNNPAAHLGGVYKAVENFGGITWTVTDISSNLRDLSAPVYPLKNAQINDITVSDIDPNLIWVVFGNVENGVKVFRTNNGGTSWTNISGCLPNIPVFTIVYQKGSNNKVYIGTQMGVYYHDDDMDSPDKWVKYGNDQVEAAVYDLDINYCGNYLVAATYGRAIRQVPLIPNDELATTSYTAPLEFNDGAVHNIYTDIRVNPYSSIIISNGTTLNMAKDKKIIIEQNGVLKVDDGTITNECNSMWEGIIVKGSNNLPPKPFNGIPSIPLSDFVIGQGVLILKNATISNAHEAIRLYNPDAPYVSTMISDQTGEAGGIVQAENSSFINNKRSCEFMYYHYFDPITGIEAPNISYFTNCTFTTDDNHRTEYPFANHITMWSVNGVNISSCLFKNDKTATTLTSAELMGQGIYTMDASYTVKYSGFENLTRGLQAIQGGNGSVNVFKTGFKDNLMGLYLIAGINSSIKTNSFKSGTMTISPPSYLIPVGASFLGNSKYGFSNNTFTGTSLDIGSWICNSGSDDNLCFSNYYESNTYANLSNYKNRKSDGFLGLQYKCNINKDNIKDFTVYSPGGTSTLGYGIRDNQGSATEYVGNIFSLASSSDPLSHFDQRDAKVTYYVPPFTAIYDPDLARSSPVPFFNKIPTGSNPESTCPIKSPPSSSNITGAVISGMAYYNGDGFTKLTATERTNMENSFITNKSNYVYFSNQLKNLIDNGNTPELIESIQASSQAADLRATLLSSSPYLSAEALMAASDQTAVLSEAMLFEILCANPEALNDQALLEYLQTKNIPLPQWMIDVLQNNTNTTARTLMEYAISNAHDKMMVDARAILQDIQFNPEGLNHEEMRFWLGQLHDVEADYSIIDDYIELGNYNDAQIIMNSIPLLYKLDKYQSAEYQTMLDLNNWKLDLFQNGSKSYTTMSENEKSSLQAIADNGFGLGKYKAENILNYFANGTYLHLPELPNNQNQRRANPIKSIAESKEVYIKAYPNPAKDLLIFEFQLPCVEKEALLEIIDITGKKVYEVNVQNEMHQHILDVQKFANGLYSYTLKCGGSIISNGKVSIQK